MNKKIVIIGAGIIGLCTAYYLRKEGHEVIIIDKSDVTKGASFVNAGYISPSHLIPLSAPGMITKGLKWMFNPASPFYVKPRWDKDLLTWARAFKRSATKAKVERAIPIIKDISLLSRSLYEELKASGEFNFHYERKGMLMLCKTEKALEAEWQVAEKAISEGLNVKEVSREQLKQYEPLIDLNVKGAVFFDCDAHMTPGEFMTGIVAYLQSDGVVFHTEEEVTDITVSEEKITEIKTAKRTLKPDEVVIAAGSWSPLLTRKLGVKIPLQAGKGYRINVKRPTKIQTPAILVEAKVAVTPMHGFTRFGGTMEIGGINHDINPVRVKAIARASESYYEGLQIQQAEIEDAACGLRPCSPDGLPYIGKPRKCQNLTIATGHAMMGWSLGPATGKLVSEIISEKKTSMDIEAFHPDRKF